MAENIKLVVQQKNGSRRIVVEIRNDYNALNPRYSNIKCNYYFQDKPDEIKTRWFQTKGELNNFMNGKWDIRAHINFIKETNEVKVSYDTSENTNPNITSFRQALNVLSKGRADYIETLKLDIERENKRHEENIKDIQDDIETCTQRINFIAELLKTEAVL